MFIWDTYALSYVYLTVWYQIFMQKAISVAYIKTVHNFYRGCVSTVIVGNKLAQDFDVMKDFKAKGCSIASVLFKIYINTALGYGHIRILSVLKQKC